jgi:purine-binding chemotaxis protein CheW
MSSVPQAQTTQQYCTFTVADHLFGIEVTRVQEVLRKQEITFVPKAPKEIVGLLNLRGQILPAIDLRTRLGFSDIGALRAVNVICVSPDGPVDFLADKVGDVLTVDESSWAPVPDSMDGRLREAVLCIHKLKDQLLLVLDPDTVAELES